jgi:DNA-binding response OmpR family regulator
MIFKHYNCVKLVYWEIMESVNTILKSINILYAEDDDVIRTNTSKTLKLFCNDVFEVNNGADALELFQKKPISIVILDYVMPSFDGYHVAKEIRKTDKDIPIFITSSYTEKEKLLSMIGLNITGYMEKPVDFNELMQMLQKCADILVDTGRLKSSFGEGLEYDYINKNILVDDKVVELTKHEYQFIEMLLKHKPSAVLTQDIEDTIFSGGVELNTLRNMVYRLRKKINRDVIVTIKEIGYILNTK